VKSKLAGGLLQCPLLSTRESVVLGVTLGETELGVWHRSIGVGSGLIIGAINIELLSEEVAWVASALMSGEGAVADGGAWQRVFLKGGTRARRAD
jgi:hypothetical protein